MARLLDVAETVPADTEHDLPQLLGRNLRRLRVRQGHSLERLAKLSGVSRAMLSQIETGKSAPTISLLWKIATALGVPFAALLDSQKTHGTVVLRRSEAKILASRDGRFTTRALFPFDGEHNPCGGGCMNAHRCSYTPVILANHARKRKRDRDGR